MRSRRWGSPEVDSLVELTSIDIDVWRRNGIEFEEEVPFALCFNQGKVEFNSAELIRSLFDKRREAKRLKKLALSNSLKLLMNSVYGKTIQKANDSSVTIYRGSFDQMISRVSKYYNRIEHVLKIQESEDGKHDVYYIKKFEPSRTYSSLCHFGCLLLSTSKDLMQRGIYVSELLKGKERGLPGHPLAFDRRFVYTDTDSYFCHKSALTEEWRQKYVELYGQEPMSNALGALSSDIKVKLPSEYEQAGPPAIYLGYFVGKKVYLVRHITPIRRKASSESPSYLVGETIRCKGISRSAIEHCLATKFSGNSLGLFQSLAVGEPVSFDLAAQGGKLQLDQKTQSYCITKSFTRTIQIR